MAPAPAAIGAGHGPLTRPDEVRLRVTRHRVTFLDLSKTTFGSFPKRTTLLCSPREPAAGGQSY
eukprot:9071450-Pyramimonas_sp.AAC.1